LIVVIIANAGVAALYLLGIALNSLFPGVETWALVVVGALSILNVISAVALLRWKKWGFWGFCTTSVIAVVMNIILGVALYYIASGFLGVVILYLVLQIGKNNKGWPQLH
jgi:hypothetical protein